MQEELAAHESEAIGTALRVIVADFPIEENQILGGFNSRVFAPESGGTHLCVSIVYTIPVLGADGDEKFKVTGVISRQIEDHIDGDIAS